MDSEMRQPEPPRGTLPLRCVPDTPTPLTEFLSRPSVNAALPLGLRQLSDVVEAVKTMLDPPPDLPLRSYGVEGIAQTLESLEHAISRNLAAI